MKKSMFALFSVVSLASLATLNPVALAATCTLSASAGSGDATDLTNTVTLSSSGSTWRGVTGYEAVDSGAYSDVFDVGVSYVGPGTNTVDYYRTLPGGHTYKEFANDGGYNVSGTYPLVYSAWSSDTNTETLAVIGP